MKRRPSATASTLLGAAMTAALLAGCSSSAATSTPRPSPTVTAAPPLASASAPAASGPPAGSPSTAPSASAAATDSVTIGLPHVDASTEDLLPSIIGGVSLEKFSLVLSAYIASSSGGDRSLYAPWLLGFGMTPDDVNMAVATDLTQSENFVVHAIKVPGVDDATLSSSFGSVARKAGWPVSTKSVATRTVLEIIDPAAAAAGALSVGYVYAKNGILYTVITDDSALLLEALIKLP